MSLTDQLIKLLPQGEAWPRAAGTNLWRTVSLFAGAIRRAIEFADYAKAEVFPLTAQDSIDVWRSSVGLPDPLCPPLTPAQQRMQMIARVENLGGQSPQYMIDFAASIGYDISITELAVARAGVSGAGWSQSNDLGADHVWVVRVANAHTSLFRASINRAGDRLAVSSDTLWLQYELNRLKPSHTIIEFPIS